MLQRMPRNVDDETRKLETVHDVVPTVRVNRFGTGDAKLGAQRLNVTCVPSGKFHSPVIDLIKISLQFTGESD